MKYVLHVSFIRLVTTTQNLRPVWLIAPSLCIANSCLMHGCSAIQVAVQNGTLRRCVILTEPNDLALPVQRQTETLLVRSQNLQEDGGQALARGWRLPTSRLLWCIQAGTDPVQVHTPRSLIIEYLRLVIPRWSILPRNLTEGCFLTLAM